MAKLVYKRNNLVLFEDSIHPLALYYNMEHAFKNLRNNKTYLS